MLDAQLARRGIRDPRVLDAFRRVDRAAFVTSDLVGSAYADSPLPIGEGQTISQPYIVALMAETLELEGHERVLEVGTGSGYAAAILSRLAGEVFTIERVPTLAEVSRARLIRLGHSNTHVRLGDGTQGWPEHAPFDAITVAACGAVVPEALLAQLAVGGRLVIPTGDVASIQVLKRFTRVSANDVREESLLDVRFVPLIAGEPRRESAPWSTPPSHS